MIFPIAIREKGCKNYLYNLELDKSQENQREPIVVEIRVLDDGIKVPITHGYRYKVTITEYSGQFP